MDLSLVVGALSVVVNLTIWVFAAALAGGVVSGIIRVVTGMEEEILSIFFRALAVFFLLYIFSGPGWEVVLEYTERIWGEKSTYSFSTGN